jgi:exopolysaccharide biosynthesis protein
MKDFIYNIRRFFLHSRRRHRPGVQHFWLNFRKDPVFRLIVILVFLVATAAVAFVLLLTVFPDNPVKAMFANEELKEVSMTEETSPSPEPTPSPTQSPSPTPYEATPTPLETQPEKETITAWITAESGLIVRTGPSSQTAKLGTLAYGTKVEIIQEGAWHFIEYNEGGGYVHSNYVVIGESPPGTETKNTNTVQTWTHLMNSAKVLAEKIFYEGVTYYIAEIETDAQNIFTAYSSEYMLPTEFLVGKDYAFAVNGDFFGFRDDGIIIRNGKLLRDEKYSELAALYDDGRLEVYFEGEITSDKLIEDDALHTWSFGPILVKDGAAYESFEGRSEVDGANPRTGIGMIEPGHYIFIVVDGRQENSRGYTLAEFAGLFEEYGCQTAYNLDGGGTSVLLFENEIISSPSGGEERATSDIIYIGSAE